MVVASNFQEILDLSSKTDILSLPSFKASPLKIRFEDADGSETVYEGQELLLPFAQTEAFEAPMVNWRRLTATNDECKPVYEITFDVSDRKFDFQPGDTIGIIPHNKTAEIETILEHLELSDLADRKYVLTVEKSVKGAKIPPHIPVESTLRHVLTHCVDVRGILKKLFILSLSRHTKDENERKILEYLCSKEGSNTYTTHVLNKNLCIMDFFTIFRTCKPPIEILLTNLPRLLPRPYSIVNSRHKDPNKIKICFSVMEMNNRKGLTTGWLEDLILKEESLEEKMKNLNVTSGKNSQKVPIYLRKNVSGFSLPDNSKTPLLLIGPGTGVAPFIGFLEERQVTKDIEQMGQILLYFGCRKPELDFIYEEELNGFVANGTLTKLCSAFSRIDHDDVKYVQDALFRDGAEIAKFIQNGAEIFICGNVKTIAPQVRATLVECLAQYGGKSLEEADKFLSDMQKDKKFHVDSWS